MANRYIYRSLPILSEIRKEKYTQEEMAALIRVELGRRMGRKYYGHLETGERLASAQVATIIARILDKKSDELFVLADKEEEHEEEYEHEEEEVQEPQLEEKGTEEHELA